MNQAKKTMLALTGVIALPVSAEPQVTPSIAITLTPQMAAGEVQAIEVVERLEGYSGEASASALSVPSRIALTRGQGYTEGDIRARDAVGPLPLKLTNVPSSGGQPLDLQIFTPARPPQGAIELSYLATVTAAMSPRPPGPSYDLRGTLGGFGGAFFSFLLLPTKPDVANVSVRWDMTRMPAGASGVTTSGAGELSLHISPAALNPIFLLGGKVSSFAPPGSKFHTYWIGTPPFDAAALSQWAAKSFDVLQTFFREPDARPFTLLMRPYANPRDGGGATRGGFMLEYGIGKLSDASREVMFTHEMVHHFVGGLDGDSSSVAWFGEGLAEFFKARLPYRAKLIGLEAAAHEFDVMTEAYYTSPLVLTPYAEVSRARWSAGAAQSVPYNRGFMYFVDLNAKIVAQSRGKRSLDDLVLAMLARRAKGQTYDEVAWRDLLQAELGDAGPAGLDAMQAGKLIVPASDAFGACFHRIEVQNARRPVLGFNENAILAAPHVVTGLVDKSAAFNAGLRSGDIITHAIGAFERIAHSASNLRLDPEVTLTIQRDGQSKRVKFSTQGQSISRYRWVSITSAARGCEVA